MKPGSTVICINDEFSEEVLEILNVLPKKGYEYNVRDIVPDPLGKLPASIALAGLENPKGWIVCKHGMVIVEFHFRANWFLLKKKAEKSW
jgi:hypothetical protein